VVRPAVPDPPELSGPLWEGFSGSVGWDVGANCGQSVPVMRERFGRVVSFEPCQASFDYARAAYPDAEMYRVALSDHEGTVELALLGGEQEETGQLVTPGTRGMEWDPGSWDPGRVSFLTVPCRTIDSQVRALGAPDFVKVDTEGHEFHVLLGGLGLLKLRKASWLVEFHSPGLRAACTDLLDLAGLAVQTVRHPHYAPDSPMWHQHGWLRARPRGTGAE
jgi:FkbM family methyltransferase